MFVVLAQHFFEPGDRPGWIPNLDHSNRLKIARWDIARLKLHRAPKLAQSTFEVTTEIRETANVRLDRGVKRIQFLCPSQSPERLGKSGRFRQRQPIPVVGRSAVRVQLDGLQMFALRARPVPIEL